MKNTIRYEPLQVFTDVTVGSGEHECAAAAALNADSTSLTNPNHRQHKHQLMTNCSQHSASTTSHQYCPRITRTKLLSAVVFLLACILLTVYTCYSSICCPGSGGAAGSTISGTMLTNELKEKIRDGKIRYKHTQRRLPQCIIIGVRKGGTRALLEFLNLHPNIQAERSEMHFFDDDETYSYGLEWYRKKMPYSFSSQVTIEKTPAYFTSEMAPERIFAMNRTVKLLIIVRDPVERAISDYTQIYFNKKEKGYDFESFEQLAIDTYGRVNKSYKAIRRSMYYKHIERWLHFFPLSKMHFVNGDKLVSDPTSELRKVEDFLEIEHQLTQEKFYYNKTRGFYCMHLDKKEKCLAKSKGRTHPDVRPEVIGILRKFFRPLNQKFYNMVEQDFNWPSD